MNDERLKKYMDEAFKFSFNFYKKETKLINELENLKKQLSKKDDKLKKANELINQCDNYLMILENSTSSADLCNDVINFRETLKEMKGEL